MPGLSQPELGAAPEGATQRNGTTPSGNGHVDPQTNGQHNGQANGQTNGQVKASTNGKVEKDAHASRIYNGLAKLYDPLFARVFYPRISRTIHRLDLPANAKVLELGVGTGLSIEAYPPHARVLGIDYSAAMLEQARKKRDKRGLHHIELAEMDATALDLPDDSFDFVMAFHVVTVVPEPTRLMEEAFRVCKPGGTVMVINHFRPETGALARFEIRYDRMLRGFGWTTMTMAEMFAATPLECRSIYHDAPHSLFYAVELRKPD
jgi:phosphatidylethanolamine/phosphatidyl-N-methylethanolamine N-methyltransferase